MPNVVSTVAGDAGVGIKSSFEVTKLSFLFLTISRMNDMFEISCLQMNE